MERIVLGAGPVGLISAYLLDAVAVGDAIPSPVSKYAPTYFWRTAKTEELLRRLDLKFSPRVARFGYLHCEGIERECPPMFREVYYRRSRGISQNAKVEIPTSVMSSGLNSVIPTFDVDLETIVARLAERVSRINDRVVSISRSGSSSVLYFGGRGTSGWGYGRVPSTTVEIVNTLPAPMFDLISRRPDAPVFAAGTKTFVVGKPDRIVAEARETWRECEFAYVVDHRLPFDRVRFLPDGEVSYEFNVAPEAISPGFLAKIDGRIAFTGDIQVLGNSREPHEPGVYHVGRMARWHHGIRLHDVVEELLS